MRAAFLDWGSVSSHDLSQASLTDLPVTWQFYDNTRGDQIARRVAENQIIVTNKVLIDQAVISRAPDLKLICIAATGTNNVDLAAASRQAMAVCNVTGYATDSVVQHVFMLVLNLFRQFPAYQDALRSGRWQTSEHFCVLDYSIESLTGKTLGIVGYGELGKAVAGMAKQFGMQVLIAQRLAGDAVSGRLPLEALLPEVDVLSLHCPLTEQTRNLITQRELSMMKPAAFLINTARGGIVNEADLLAALKARRIAGAAVDVLDHEPPGDANPLIQAGLANLIVTPHIAWASRQARQKLIDAVAENIRAWLNNEALINQVN